MAVNSPGAINERQLGRSTHTQKFTNLAVGTHVVEVKPGRSLTVFVESTGGDVDIDYTMDPDRTLDDGVAAPSTDFAAGVLFANWAEGAPSAGVSETIDGPITAVRITIGTAAVNIVTLAPHC
jgi:hypothetical protein